MPRKVVTRSPHWEVGVVNPVWLLDHAVEHESHLERRFIMVALTCPVVVDNRTGRVISTSFWSKQSYLFESEQTFCDVNSRVLEICQ